MYAISAWAMDFLRALNERPFLCKVFLRLLFGKYAYREFIGMRDAVEKETVGIDIGYDLKEIDYQKDKVPIKWWR